MLSCEGLMYRLGQRARWPVSYFLDNRLSCNSSAIGK
jgi:hypothetical protein